jgi:hypothetical protein
VPDDPMPSTGRRYSPSRLGSLHVSLLHDDTYTQPSLPIPVATNVEFAEVCPDAIVDTDPQGQGLGIWVLVDSGVDENGDRYCSYEYSGGIG